MKIYDCFNFFKEFDILEIRLNTLFEHVDYFVIVESSVKHSGEPKPFYFEENSKRFSKFFNKIIYYKVYDTPNIFYNLPQTNDRHLQDIFKFINLQTKRFNIFNQPDYGRDFFQKECVRRALGNCRDEDLILFSDADEIPNPKIFTNLNNLNLENKVYALNQITYYYYINALKQTDWYGSRMGLYKNIKSQSLNELRNEIHLTEKLSNGGWHFSFMGGPEMVKDKILSYSARELVTNDVLNNIENNINNNIDPFFRSKLEIVQIDKTYPKFILENIEKFKHMIKFNL